MKIKCFKPVINATCKVLILGSVPSVKSRQNGFYYGNPANRFWKIMSEIFGVDFTAMSNDDKKTEILARGVALSDVFSVCDIKGSADGSIKNAEFNDIPSLIRHTDIKTIYITSKKAYIAFKKQFGKYFDSIGIPVINLPSTSGANRSKFPTDQALLTEWHRLFKV